ncbi:MAG TPA: hypothetical protein DEP28_09480 [Bacteroidetes bacterium]|nr:hypothetical protein [Bacteroidota bacterium]HCN36660.1 hypothetical protein [Bacteroidota bacterium]
MKKLQNEFMNNLNESQIEILKLFDSHKSEEDLISLKKYLKNYLSDKFISDIKKSNYELNEIPDYRILRFRISDKNGKNG